MVITTADMVAKAKGRIENLTVDEASREIDGDKVLVVDLREADESEQNGAIPGSIHAPRGMLEFWADPTSAYHRQEFDPAQRIILYCASGGRSALAAITLGELGYDKVAHLDGGLKAWKEQGRPVEHNT
jgi:rhodanese-related sulfurtransferase